MKTKKTRILIADDHSVVRMGLAALMGYQPDLEVVGEADDGESAIDLAGKLRPDLVIMDLVMPGMGGIAAAGRILDTCEDVSVLILTSFGTSADLTLAAQTGISGIVLKDAVNEELLTAIRTVAAGGTYYSAEIAELLDGNPDATLSKRQRELLAYAARGLSNGDIATALGISENAVKHSFTTLFRRLGVANRTEAVSFAADHRLV